MVVEELEPELLGWLAYMVVVGRVDIVLGEEEEVVVAVFESELALPLPYEGAPPPYATGVLGVDVVEETPPVSVLATSTGVLADTDDDDDDGGTPLSTTGIGVKVCVILGYVVVATTLP